MLTVSVSNVFLIKDSVLDVFTWKLSTWNHSALWVQEIILFSVDDLKKGKTTDHLIYKCLCESVHHKPTGLFVKYVCQPIRHLCAPSFDLPHRTMWVSRPRSRLAVFRGRGAWGEVRSHRLMRPAQWQGYRVLQNRRPAGTTYPLCFLGTPNCPYEYFRGEQERRGLGGLLFQGLWWLMIQSAGQDGWERQTGSERKKD